MKWQKQVVQNAQRFLHENLKTVHGRIVLSGLAIGLCYFPVWLGGLVGQTVRGSAGLPLIVAAVCLGFYYLWTQRLELAKLKASEEDRLLGHLFILSGAILFPFCRFAIWSQALLWLLILVGIACSTWGITFFRMYRLPVLLLAISVYPRPSVTARALWDVFVPQYAWNSLVAWLASLALQVIGHPAVAIGAIVSLPKGSVEVSWGCNGLSMAMSMATAGLVMGLLYKQPWQKIFGLIVIGIAIALTLNIPRIVLLAIAAVYWGKASFDFWHGTWGGQIFSAIVFTAYYYVVMWIVNRHKITPLRSGNR